MKTMYDNVGLPAEPPDVDATAYYAGGEDPYRIWPMDEVNQIKTRYKLPIWVNSAPTDKVRGYNDGAAFGYLQEKLGQPIGTCVCLDLEMSVNDEYVQAFDRGTRAFGYLTMIYGSASTLLKNKPTSGGYFIAQWDGVPEIPAGIAAKQYASDMMIGKAWDLSVVSDSVPLWDTRKKDYEVTTLSTGKNAVSVMPFKRGQFSTLVLLADNGAQGLPGCTIRVAENYDGEWHISTVNVDSAHGASEVKFKNGETVHGVSIRREDDSTVVVGASLY